MKESNLHEATAVYRVVRRTRSSFLIDAKKKQMYARVRWTWCTVGVFVPVQEFLVRVWTCIDNKDNIFSQPGMFMALA